MESPAQAVKKLDPLANNPEQAELLHLVQQRETSLCDAVGFSLGYKGYATFPPSVQIRQGLITPEIVAHLQSGARLCSHGVAYAYLEQLLRDGFNIPNNQIVVTDAALHPRVLQSGLNCRAFNLNDSWPDLGDPFDYVLFPDSFGVGVVQALGMFYNSPGIFLRGDSAMDYFDALDRFRSRIILDGPESLPPADRQLFAEAAQTIYGENHLSDIMHVIGNAASRLRPKGQIRLTSDYLSQDQCACIVLARFFEGRKISYRQFLQTKVFQQE
jgi:hypothetical protein